MILTPENLQKRLDHYNGDDMIVHFTKGELREMLLLIYRLTRENDDLREQLGQDR